MRGPRFDSVVKLMRSILATEYPFSSILLNMLNTQYRKRGIREMALGPARFDEISCAFS